jgi:hypothetical protein
VPLVARPPVRSRSRGGRQNAAHTQRRARRCGDWANASRPRSATFPAFRL